MTFKIDLELADPPAGGRRTPKRQRDALAGMDESQYD